MDLFPVKPIDLFQEVDGVFSCKERFFEVDSQDLGGLFTVCFYKSKTKGVSLDSAGSGWDRPARACSSNPYVYQL